MAAMKIRYNGNDRLNPIIQCLGRAGHCTFRPIAIDQLFVDSVLFINFHMRNIKLGFQFRFARQMFKILAWDFMFHSSQLLVR